MTILKRLKQLLSGSPRTLASRDAYTKWVATYPPIPHNAFMQAEQDSMLKLMPSLENKTVLDLACGTGRYVRIAQERGAHIVVGLDNSYPMLHAADQKSLACAETSALCLPDNSVDAILCGLALGHQPSIDKTMSEISRVLRSNGSVLISDLHPYQTLTGAQRTFSVSDGTTYAVEHYLHTLSDYINTAQVHQLQITALDEPAVHGDTPAVLVMRFDKMK
ncbi:MAG: class I SAM-dependent methyltransferase [Chloroflexota bacterium]